MRIPVKFELYKNGLLVNVEYVVYEYLSKPAVKSRALAIANAICADDESLTIYLSF